MDVFQNHVMLILVSIYPYTTLAFVARLTSKTFSYKHEYQGKTCPTEDHIFTMIIRRKTACVELCSRTTGCTAVTFIQSNSMCTGCKGFYPSSINLADQSEALFYIVDCGTPEAVKNVQFHDFDGYTRYGAEVEFDCTPCTYFSLSSTWTIRCQADGTWTIPDCVYGPNVGHLMNGDVIPTGAVGCNSTFGTMCHHDQKVTGTVLRYNGEMKSECFCDHACCNEQDCCFDSTC